MTHYQISETTSVRASNIKSAKSNICSVFSNIIGGDKPNRFCKLFRRARKQSSIKVAVHVDLEGYTEIIGETPSSPFVGATPSSGFQILENGMFYFITRKITKPYYEENFFGFKRLIPGHVDFFFRQYTPKTLIEQSYSKGINSEPYRVQLTLRDDDIIFDEELQFSVEIAHNSVNLQSFQDVISFEVDI